MWMFLLDPAKDTDVLLNSHMRTFVVGRKAQVVQVERHERERRANERRHHAHEQQHVQPRVAPNLEAARLSAEPAVDVLQQWRPLCCYNPGSLSCAAHEMAPIERRHSACRQQHIQTGEAPRSKQRASLSRRNVSDDMCELGSRPFLETVSATSRVARLVVPSLQTVFLCSAAEGALAVAVATKALLWQDE